MVAGCAEPSAATPLNANGAAARACGHSLTFGYLYETYFASIYRMISRYGVAPADVEDLAQRVFLAAHEQLSRDVEPEKPEAWLRTIGLHVVHEYFRWRRVRRVKAWLVEYSWAGRSTVEQTPETLALRDECLEGVRWVLTRMSSKLRDALVLLDLEELSPREAAELLAIPLNTVRSRRALARVEFRRLWQVYENQESIAP
jgi:RNA polymerase sigma factor (sigma-70 family)